MQVWDPEQAPAPGKEMGIVPGDIVGTVHVLLYRCPDRYIRTTYNGLGGLPRICFEKEPLLSQGTVSR